MGSEPEDSLNRALNDARTVQDFLNDLAYRRRMSQRTVESYRNDLRQFSEFLTGKGVTGITACTRENILEFLIAGHEKGECSRTSARRLSALRSFFTFLKHAGRISESPVTGIKSSAIQKGIPEVLTKVEIEKLMEAGYKGGKAQRRAGVLLELMYATGVRISEAIGLRLENLLLDDENPAVIIQQGKGGKPRLAPIPEHTVLRLREYMSELRPLILGDGYSPFVFATRSGKKLSRQEAWRNLKTLGRIAGIEDKLHPHILRHTCATHMLDNGCDLRTVQMLLNHADLSSTEIYTHVLEERKRNVFRSAHPRATRKREADSDG